MMDPGRIIESLIASWKKHGPMTIILVIVLMLGVKFLFDAMPYIAKRTLDTEVAASPSKSKPEKTMAPAVPAPLPSSQQLEAPGGAIGAPSRDGVKIDSSAAEASPSVPSGPCGDSATMPTSASAFRTAKDRVCALSACSGNPLEGSPLAGVLEWQTFTERTQACNIADLEALTISDTTVRLMDLVSSTPNGKGASDICFDLRQLIVEDIEAIRKKVKPTEDVIQRCGDRAKRDVSEEINGLLVTLGAR